MNALVTPTIANAAALVGRLALAALFLPAGIQKITGYAGTVGYMESAGVPLVGVLLPLAILVEVGGGIALLTGFGARLGALALAGFTLVASVIFHAFWNMTGMDAMMQQLMFMKNIAVIGGLLFVFAFGPGAWVLGARQSKLATA